MGFSSAEQVELAPNASESFSPARGCLHACTSVNLISFVPLHLWHKIISAKPTETCKPVLLHFWNACKQSRTHYSNYLTISIQIFDVISSTASMLFHAQPSSTAWSPSMLLTFGYCWTGMRTRSESLMFLLLMMSRYFFMSPSFFISSPSHFSISARKKKQTKQNHKAN